MVGRVGNNSVTCAVKVEALPSTKDFKSDADVNVPAPPSLDLSESLKSVDAEVIASRLRFAPQGNDICFSYNPAISVAGSFSVLLVSVKKLSKSVPDSFVTSCSFSILSWNVLL